MANYICPVGLRLEISSLFDDQTETKRFNDYKLEEKETLVKSFETFKIED